MKKLGLTLVIGCVLGMGFCADLVWADSCECICISDNTCSAISSCSDGNETGCNSVQFTAECSGSYSLKYDFSCSGSVCKACFVCVFVKDGDGDVVGVCHASCQTDQCDGQCVESVNLEKDKPYTLFVCLRNCFGLSCEDCSNCTGRGYLYKHDSDCSLSGQCNP